MIWIAIAVTVAGFLFGCVIFAGNKGSFHNYIDPRADWLLVADVVAIALAWILYGVLR